MLQKQGRSVILTFPVKYAATILLPDILAILIMLRDGNPVPRTAQIRAYYNASQWFGHKKYEKIDFLC